MLAGKQKEKKGKVVTKVANEYVPEKVDRRPAMPEVGPIMKIMPHFTLSEILDHIEKERIRVKSLGSDLPK